MFSLIRDMLPDLVLCMLFFGLVKRIEYKTLDRKGYSWLKFNAVKVAVKERKMILPYIVFGIGFVVTAIVFISKVEGVITYVLSI